MPTPLSIDLRPGRQVNAYILERHLGRGAAGEVWQARAQGRVYALKFMNENLLDGAEAEKHLARLKYEIRSLIQLRHVYVPRLYGYNLAFERPYLVMQYIEDPALSQLIATGDIFTLPLGQRFKMLCLLAVTLSAAHQHGIIHRDVKPANIKGINPPYLIDFGIAWDAQSDSYGQHVGTPTYMPPWDAPLDESADYYSFALVAYETLFGRHPLFDSQNIGRTAIETRQKAAAYLEGKTWCLPSRLSLNQIPPDLRHADLKRLDQVFERALGPGAGRYPDLNAFLEDLGAGLRAGYFKPPAEGQYEAFLAQRQAERERRADHPEAKAEIEMDTHLPDEIPRRRAYVLLSLLVFVLVVLLLAALSLRFG